jgi:hypothetical protein
VQISIDEVAQKAAAGKLRGLLDALAQVVDLLAQGANPADGVLTASSDGIFVSCRTPACMSAFCPCVCVCVCVCACVCVCF